MKWGISDKVTPLLLLPDPSTQLCQVSTHTSARVDVLCAGRLPDQVVLVESRAVLSHHHRLGSSCGPGVHHLGHWISI